MPRTRRSALVGIPWLPTTAPPVSVAGARRRRGHGRTRAPDDGNGSGKLGGSAANASVGTAPTQGNQRVASDGKAARQRRYLTPVRNSVQQRAGKRK
jgi:hypothetical protein